MPSLTPSEVIKVADLARLQLTDDELETFAPQLARIVEYVDRLNELDTAAVEPMAHAIDVANVFRDDFERPSLPREKALANAPASDGTTFLVPAILERGGME